MDDAAALRALATELRARFGHRIGDLSELLRLLCSPLSWLDVLASPIPKAQLDERWTALPDALRPEFIRRWAQHLQVSILESGIAIDWRAQLGEAESALDAWFAPDSVDAGAIGIAISAYGAISTQLARSHLDEASLQELLRLLNILVVRFPLHRLAQTATDWPIVVQLVVSLSAKVANAVGAAETRTSGRLTVPATLEWRAYNDSLATSFSVMVDNRTPTDRLALLLGKLARSGAFPTDVAICQTHGFWRVVLPLVRERQPWPPTLEDSYCATWSETMRELDANDFSSVASSALVTLQSLLPRSQLEEPLVNARRAVKTAAALLSCVFGRADSSTVQDLLISRVLLVRDGWTDDTARTVCTWVASDSGMTVSTVYLTLRRSVGVPAPIPAGLVLATLRRTRSHCATSVYVGVSLRAHFVVVTLLLLLCAVRLPRVYPELVKIAHGSAFMEGVQAHLSTTRVEVRFLGMLAAEVMSARSLDPAEGVKPLNFGDEIWSGDGSGRIAARELRQLLESAPDSAVEGWADLSTAKPAPPAQPTVRPAARTQPVQPPSRSKIQVIASSTQDSDDEFEPYPMPDEPELSEDDETSEAAAFDSSAARKRVSPPVYISDLASYLRTDSKDARIAAERIELALKTGPQLIRRKADRGTELCASTDQTELTSTAENAADLTFALLNVQNNYEYERFEELQQAMMAALVACAPQHSAPVLVEQFFNNQYSTAQRYAILGALAAGARELAGLPDLGGVADSSMTDTVTRRALSSTRDSADANLAEAGRERVLTMRKFRSADQPSGGRSAKFATLAAGTFVMPLINRMWLYLRDTATATSQASYLAAGTGTLLQPLVMARYLGTLSILLDAARLSPQFLAIIAPDSIELALALRVGPDDDESVLCAALGLVLVALDVSTMLDAGHMLANRHPRTVAQVQAWADQVWHERAGDERVHRAAAGVLLRIEELQRRSSIVGAIAAL